MPSLEASMKIAVVLSAYDKMSQVINNATNNAQKKFSEMAKAKFLQGGATMAAGVAIAASMAPAVRAYADLEQSSIDLKTAMMDSTGAVDKNYQRIDKLAVDLGNKLPGTTADFHNMFQALFNNGIKSEQILKGVGKAAAFLAVDLKMPYDVAGIFAAKMKVATGIADDEMLKFMDTISRTAALGVDATEMQYAFSRSAGTLKSMGLQGLQASKDMAVLYAQLIRTGLTGETSATSFNSIMQALLNPTKFAKFSKMTADVGKHLDFFKDGKFMGVENMIAQFDKLKDLSQVKKAQLINALTGGGQDAQAMSVLVNAGTDGYKKMRAEMEKKASLDDKIKLKLQTLNAMWEATTGTITNMLAALGEGLMPVLKPLAQMIGDVAGKIQEWLSENPALAKFISLAVSLVGVSVTMLGVIKVIQGIKFAMIALNLAMKSNPFILFASIAILAISLIYANWDKIKTFFTKLWNNVKIIFKATWQWIKQMFLSYTPQGLVIKHWAQIAAFFSGMWAKIKGIFSAGLNWVKEKFNGILTFVFGIGKRFYDAGANIINSIINGITGKVTALVNKVKGVAQKIRAFFPFSPAKEGPLKDIHRVKIVETIAQSIKPNALVNKMRSVTKSVAGVGFKGVNSGSGGGGSFSPTFHIYLSGSATKADGDMISGRIKKELSQLMKQYNHQRERVSFG